MPPEEVLRARDRFCAWLKWFLTTYPKVVPTEAALARKLGMGKPALNRLLREKSQVIPSLRTLMAAEKLTGVPLNVLLKENPPEL